MVVWCASSTSDSTNTRTSARGECLGDAAGLRHGLGVQLGVEHISYVHETWFPSTVDNKRQREVRGRKDRMSSPRRMEGLAPPSGR